ncbi:MAG: hypothetical protein S4CHLAM20_01390 [Chlamydiia bacterium]|nr:hypothetical protein [Chlamydiia bacterium]
MSFTLPPMSAQTTINNICESEVQDLRVAIGEALTKLANSIDKIIKGYFETFKIVKEVSSISIMITRMKITTTAKEQVKALNDELEKISEPYNKNYIERKYTLDPLDTRLYPHQDAIDALLDETQEKLNALIKEKRGLLPNNNTTSKRGVSKESKTGGVRLDIARAMVNT